MGNSEKLILFYLMQIAIHNTGALRCLRNGNYTGTDHHLSEAGAVLTKLHQRIGSVMPPGA